MAETTASNVKLETEEEADVITCENVGEKLRKHDLQASMTNTRSENLYALVDMGSNGIRLSISDFSPSTARLLPCIYRHRIPISLYDALHSPSTPESEFLFPPHIISSVAHELKRFSHLCRTSFSPPIPQANILVFATEAMRTAHNRKDMTDAIYAASGLKVQMLHPRIESLFGALGARSQFHEVDGLVMDLGGGSVQMSYMRWKEGGVNIDTESASSSDYWLEWGKHATSLPFGAAKVTAKLKQDISSSLQLRVDLESGLGTAYSTLRENLIKKLMHDKEHPKTLYLCGGGFRGYGSMLMHLDPIKPYPIPSISGYKVPMKRFKETERVRTVNEQETDKIRGLSKRRREQFEAILEVVEGVCNTVGEFVEEVVFCGGGNREGVLWLLLDEEIRHSDPVGWGSEKQISTSMAHVPVVVDGDGEDAVVRDVVHVLESMTQNCDFGASDSSLSEGGKQGVKEMWTNGRLTYLVRHMWDNMANEGEVNASKALHQTMDGDIKGSHEDIAILALTLCARWDNDVGRIDRARIEKLRELIGKERAWWCDFMGGIMKGLGEMWPLKGMWKTGSVEMGMQWVEGGLRKEGKKKNCGKGKSGWVVRMGVEREIGRGVLGWGDREGKGGGDGEEGWEEFDYDVGKVGKGLDLDWRVKWRIACR